jgi:hypothetical protein
MSAMLTPRPQQNKSKLLDQVRDVTRQTGKTDEPDRLFAGITPALPELRRRVNRHLLPTALILQS